MRLRELLFPSSSRWNFRRCNRRARRRRPWIDCGRDGAAPSGSDGATMRGDERGEEVAVMKCYGHVLSHSSVMLRICPNYRSSLPPALPDVNALGEDEVVAVDT